MESTFGRIKRKFGPDVRSKTDAAVTNAVPCGLAARNLCVLVRGQHELGIEPPFVGPGAVRPPGA